MKIRLKQKYIKYILYMQFTVAKTLLRISASTEEWLAANTFVKYCALKKLFPAINYKEKMIFRNSYSTLDHSLFLWVITYYFTFDFCTYVSNCNSVIFAFINWKGGAQQTFTCSKSTVGHYKKEWTMSKNNIKRVEGCSGVFIANFQ